MKPRKTSIDVKFVFHAHFLYTIFSGTSLLELELIESRYLPKNKCGNIILMNLFELPTFNTFKKNIMMKYIDLIWFYLKRTILWKVCHIFMPSFKSVVTLIILIGYAKFSTTLINLGENSAQCTMMRFFKTFMEQHRTAKGVHFCNILAVHITHFEGFLR